MRKLFVYFIYGAALFAATAVAAQPGKGITADFAGVPFAAFVQKIEQTTTYRFYYDEKELDSFVVNLNVSNKSLRELLQQLFQNTIFRFAIDSNNSVFITQQYPLQTSLPADFFDRKKRGPDTLAVQPVFAEGDKRKTKLNAPVENKLFEIGTRTNTSGTATIAGYLRDSKTGEPVIGAAVYIDTPAIGAVTDQYGYYSLTLPKGRQALHVSGAGINEKAYRLLVNGDGPFSMALQEDVPTLKTVVVASERRSNIRSLQMGTDRITIKNIKQVPVVFGEPDILRVVLTLPGVTSTGEGSTGFNVRGGSTDQNLILFSDATIYNPAHLFGFFSAFNPDVVKNVELYKSSIPEKYGGRLSSVLDVTTREGNSKEWSGIGGIGLLTSKLMVEGPIKQDKTAVVLGGRTTYSNWLLRQVPNESYRNSRASFYDLDLHINHTLNSNNTFYLNGYRSEDRFKLASDTAYQYGNRNINGKWKHIYNNKFNSVVTSGWDDYRYSVTGNENGIKGYRLNFSIKQAHFRTDFNVTAGQKHALNFGLHSVYYSLQPGTYAPSGAQSLTVPDTLQREQGLESALYLGDRFAISPKLSLSAGLRYSLFQYLGPQSIYSYAPGVPRQATTAKDSVQYAKGRVIQNYHGPEYRLALRYALSDSTSVKASFNTLRQYIHMLSNTSAISPTDIWKLSDPHIEPQTGWQAAVGYYRNFRSNTIEGSVELYYKKMQHYLDYKSGAALLLNHHIETAVINTRGKAYGAEFLLKKGSGKINGWISYTYSRTWLQQDDSLAGETINRGAYYPTNYDKPHNLNGIGNYRFSHRFSTSLNVIYNTGRPITLPLAVFNLGGAPRLFYSERNQYRIPDYFRVDLSVNIEGNHRIKKLTHNSWSFGLYNVTGRQNAYSIFFLQQAGVIKGYKLSIFGTAIPYITYNFRF